VDDAVRSLVLGLGWVLGWCLLWRVPRLPQRTWAGRTPGVSVVVPARDEATTLPTLLDGLARQTQPANEIIVVDDGSTDGTADIARVHSARVVIGKAVPDDWAGKPWAMWQGAQAAGNDTIVFFDADTVPAPTLLERLTAFHAELGGLLSVQPYHRMRRWWETGAFGPCLACRRADFVSHGDDASVRSSIVEDVALARRFTDAELPVNVFAGGNELAFRMYGRPRELSHGFAKNIAVGAVSTPLLRLFLIFAWVTALLVAAARVWEGDWMSLVVYGAFAVQLFVMLRQLGNFGLLTAALYPVPLTLFIVLFGWSNYLRTRGRARWKGRTVRLRSRT
jgi:4,4'-diaponeurosporenoate glycosyltransferase